MQRFYLTFTVIVIGLAVVFSGLTTGSVNSESLVKPALQTTEAMPNLSGEKAEEYLKDHGLYKSLGEAMAASRYSIYPTKNAPLPVYKEAFEANNPRQAFAAYFAKDGVHLVSKAENNKWRVQMNLTGYGYGDDIAEVEQTETNVQKDKSRIEITKSATVQSPKSKIVEWYENSLGGLEQGWTINERASNVQNAELKLVLELGGDLKAKLAADNQAINFVDEKGEPILRYDKLKSWDADGKELTSRMDLNGNQLSIVVDDTEAKYPVTVDPFFSGTKKLTASDAAAFDNFGEAVAVSGDTVIVGASGDDEGAVFSRGAAYVFERNTGGANNWGEVKKLIASDVAGADLFGDAVAISGDTIIVSARFNDDAGGNSGSAYIFSRNMGGADNWGEVKKITASDADALDEFGKSVSISGDTAIVGALRNDDAGSDSGSAYIFERNSGGADNWGEVKKLTASDAGVGFGFGESVAISDDTAIVGSRQNDLNGALSGAAYIFERNSGGVNFWGEVKRITPSNPGIGNSFGYSVSISGNTAVVGAYQYGGNGSAFIFERNTGGADNWGEVKRIIDPNGSLADTFGASVSISGNTVVVGSGFVNGGDNGGNQAFIFERNMGGADNWGIVQTLNPPDAGSADSFGESVAISGDTLIIGSSLDDVVSVDSGSANLYSSQLDNWTQVSASTSSNGNAGDKFGESVAISGDRVIVGAPFNVEGGQNGGTVYIFERNMGGQDLWGEVKRIVASDADANFQFGSSVALSGDTAIVGSVVANVNGVASGSAYIFERNTGGADYWGEVNQLLPSDAANGDRFGKSVAISNDTAIVGAYQNSGAGSASGAAYIYERNTGGGNNWGEVKKINASDAAVDDHFGKSVSIDNDTAIVGASLEDAPGLSSGSAYIFARNTGGAENWGEVKKLTASDAAAFDLFGETVSISGDTAVVGARGNSDVGSSSGSAYVFGRNSGGVNNWGEVKKLSAPDAAAFDNFGFSVSISGDIAIVGTHFDDDNGMNSGSAYIFSRNKGGGDNWGGVKKLTASDASANDQFASSVAISGNLVMIGSPFKDVAAFSVGKTSNINLAGADQGAFYIFKTLTAPTAANVSISGRVLTVNGLGIPHSIVNFTDADGNIRTARTNQFGYFRFDDVEVGQTYIFQVSAKGYLFAPQVINVGDSISGLNFSPLAN